MENLSIKDKILALYPGVVFSNQYFFSDEVLNDFSLEDIAFKLSSLSSGDSLFRYLYMSNIPVSIREMIVYIAKNNIQYFEDNDEFLFEEEKFIKEYVRLYSLQDFSFSDLEKMHLLNQKNNLGKRFYYFDIHYFNEVIIVQKLYREGKIKANDIQEFLQFNFDVIQEKAIKDAENYDLKYDNYIHEIVSYLVAGKISLEALYNGLNNFNSVKSLLAAGKFECTSFRDEKIPTEIIDVVNGKAINKLYEFLKDNYEEISTITYKKTQLLGILIRMCSLLGVSNTDNIIRHLPEDKRSIISLFECFNGIDLAKVQILNNKIVYNDDFIRLFMGDNLKEPNSLLNLIYRGETSIGFKLEELYNYWEVLMIRYSSQDLQTKLSFLESAFNESNVFLNPDEYQIEGNVIDNCYDNQRYQQLSKYEMVKRIREIYQRMKHSFLKTIPYVSGEYEDFSFQMLKANDPNLFVMGSNTDCCFKLGGDADSFVEYCAIDENGRVLSIQNKKGEVVAMVPMVRNGNLILCNSVESKYINDVSFMRKMFEVLEIVSKEMIGISFRYEDSLEALQAVLIGNYKNDIEQFEKYERIDYGKIRDKCLRPLDSRVYANMGGFDWLNYCVFKKDNLNFRDIKSFNPKIKYEDSREEVRELESEYVSEKDKKVVQSISYEKDKRLLDFSKLEKVIYNEDWFILIDKKHQIFSGIVGNDPRAIYEYQDYLEMEQEYCSYYDQEGNVVENARYR